MKKLQENQKRYLVDTMKVPYDTIQQVQFTSSNISAFIMGLKYALREPFQTQYLTTPKKQKDNTLTQADIDRQINTNRAVLQEMQYMVDIYKLKIKQLKENFNNFKVSEESFNLEMKAIVKKINQKTEAINALAETQRKLKRLQIGY